MHHCGLDFSRNVKLGCFLSFSLPAPPHSVHAAHMDINQLLYSNQPHSHFQNMKEQHKPEGKWSKSHILLYFSGCTQFFTGHEREQRET